MERVDVNTGSDPQNDEIEKTKKAISATLSDRQAAMEKRIKADSSLYEFGFDSRGIVTVRYLYLVSKLAVLKLARRFRRRNLEEDSPASS